MTLAERATLLGKLGELMRSLALTQEQFKSVKAMILNDDPRVTIQVLSVLTIFREQRAAGILTDIEYDGLVIEALEGLSGDCAPPEADDSPSSLTAQQALERNRPCAGSPGLSSGRQTAVDPGQSSGTGGSAEVPVPPHEEGSEWRTVLGKRKAANASAGINARGSPGKMVSGDRARTSNDAGKGDSTISSLVCFRRQRWAPTRDFIVPHNGFCAYDVPLYFADSTAELLEKAEQRGFPTHLDRDHLSGRLSKASFMNQGAMYRKYKKVMICGGGGGEEGDDRGKRRVYRATDEEVKNTVEAVKHETLSVAEYLDGVKELRKAQLQGKP